MGRRNRLPVLLTGVVLLLAGCGAGPDPGADRQPAAGAGHRPAGTPADPGPAGTAHNDADVMFLQMMVTHHGQGLQMVRIAEAKTTREEIRTLAAAIDVTQTDEVSTMVGWLTSWREPTGADPHASAHAHHGGMPATGPAEIEALRRASGTDFDRTFLNLLVAHQQNAADTAGTETSAGLNFQTRELARRIEESRRAEVAQMLALLGPQSDHGPHPAHRVRATVASTGSSF